MNATIECYQCKWPTKKKFVLYDGREMWFCSVACELEYAGLTDQDLADERNRGYQDESE